jgi:catechol 2,3-dioxygenase-like lactoylglutathione lyase family enzyme
VTTFLGVDHVGVGVGDADEAIEFYGRHVGFDRVLFDYTGTLPGLEAVAGRTPAVRVAMLESSSATPVGQGRVKLVQVLDGDGPPPVPAGQAWGEVGVCEICLHVRNVQEVHDALVAGGCASLMEPTSADVPPTGITLDIAYVADPWGTKLELIEWTGCGVRCRDRHAEGGEPRRVRRHRHGNGRARSTRGSGSLSCSSSPSSSSTRWRRGSSRRGTTRAISPRST